MTAADDELQKAARRIFVAVAGMPEQNARDIIEQEIASAEQRGAERMREACAKECETMRDQYLAPGCKEAWPGSRSGAVLRAAGRIRALSTAGKKKP